MGACWTAPPSDLVLGADEVHVWLVPLDGAPDRTRDLAGLLAVAERERAARFRRAADRDRFTVAHGALRGILARYLSSDPRTIPLTTDGRGKPRLAAPDGLCFNLSHSADLALCALARHCEVGIDLERLDPTLPIESTAARFFAPTEADALRALPPAARVPAFFNLWARKEAYRKACGDGLALPLDTPEKEGWTVRDLDVSDAYAAALAHAGAPRLLSCWQWLG